MALPRSARARLVAAGETLAGACSTDCTPIDASECLRTSGADVIVIDADAPAELSDALLRAALEHGASVVVVSERPTVEDAVDAMRRGATDLIDLRSPAPEIGLRLASAAERTGRVRRERAQNERLRRLCRRLNGARRELTTQVAGLCGDLTAAYADLSTQLTLVASSSEFQAAIRQELDIESLLRTALEHLLLKTGPTNAAVYLPSTSGDFTLGAYVNYDLPRERADAVFDALASTLAPSFENEHNVVKMNGRAETHACLEQAAAWLGDSAVAAFSCRTSDECLAVVVLFRDRAHPFSDQNVLLLRTVSGMFARQLARVVHVHHRHLPKSQWGGPSESFNDPDDAPDVDLRA